MRTELFELIIRQSPSFGALGVLLLFSAFFSGSETALFSLTHYDRRRLEKISTRISRLVNALLDRPEQLLLVILFANMAVNIAIYTISSLLVYQFIRARHAVFAGGIGVGTLLAVVFVGEILPKAWAYHLRIPAATIVSGPLWILVRTLQPLMTVIHTILILPLVRLLIGTEREPELSKEELHHLLEVARREGHLQTDQAELLDRLIDLRDLQVRQIMVPRVQMTACEIDIPVDNVKHLVRTTSRTRIPVYIEQVDNIVGIIRARRLWTDRPIHLKDILEHVRFVPEYQRVDQLLHFFRSEETDVAVVVDEYGGVAGMVSLEVVIEQMVEELEPQFSETITPEIIQIGPEQYIADGHFPLREFCRQFDLETPEFEIDTLAGLIMHETGHLPEVGEELDYQGLKLKVTTFHRRSLQKIGIVDHRKEYHKERTEHGLG